MAARMSAAICKVQALGKGPGSHRWEDSPICHRHDRRLDLPVVIRRAGYHSSGVTYVATQSQSPLPFACIDLVVKRRGRSDMVLITPPLLVWLCIVMFCESGFSQGCHAPCFRQCTNKHMSIRTHEHLIITSKSGLWPRLHHCVLSPHKWQAQCLSS